MYSARSCATSSPPRTRAMAAWRQWMLVCSTSPPILRHSFRGVAEPRQDGGKGGDEGGQRRRNDAIVAAAQPVADGRDRPAFQAAHADQGPPGTGKTRTACALLAACVALHSGRPPPSPPQQKQKQQPRGRGGAAAGDNGSGGSSSPCLAVASSNVAADELLAGLSAAGLKTLRVGQPASVRESLRNLTLDAALEGSAIVRKARDELRVQQDAKNAAGVGKAFEAVRRAEAAASRKLLMEADVVVASCVGSGRLNDIVSIPPSSPSSEPDMSSGRGGGGRGGGTGRGQGRGGVPLVCVCFDHDA